MRCATWWCRRSAPARSRTSTTSTPPTAATASSRRPTTPTCQYDEEFYNHLCATYGAKLREKVLFFVDNRNVIGKDVPFQLVHQKRFGEPLFYRSVVLAHDVDDFSRIWQAMGRSRTMNDTQFTHLQVGPAVGFGPAGRRAARHQSTR